MKKFLIWCLSLAVLLILMLIGLLPYLAGKTERFFLSHDAQMLVDQAFNDLTAEWVDYHAHLLGMNSENTFVNPKMKSWRNPLQFYRYKVYLRASGITQEETANQSYIKRLKYLLQAFPQTGKTYLLAFDKYYEKNGDENIEETEFYVSNDYLYKITQENQKLFQPVVSINPYRLDALNELDKWHQKGVRLIKWLPNAMGFDPSDLQLMDFYKKVKELNMAILTHVGIEIAVDSSKHQAYGNPLKWRQALDLGTKVIFAHAGSLGQCQDYETSGNPQVDCFDLALRLLSEERYQKNLFADISATIFLNRKEKILKTLLERTDLHSRLLNGSDYPIPAINLMVSTWLLQYRGYLTNHEATYLREIYHYNPLLFDFVLKRTLHLPHSTQRFPVSIFQENKNLLQSQ